MYKKDHIVSFSLINLSFTSTFILSGVLSPPIFHGILGTYRPVEFIFQCPIFLPVHAVHGALKARILKCFAIPFRFRQENLRYQGNISCKGGHNKGQKWYGPKQKQQILRRGGKNTQKTCTKKIFTTEISMLV